MLRMIWLTIAVAVALVAVPASAQTMTVAEFLAKVTTLRAKGLFALGSSDLKLIKTEMTTIGTAYRADTEGARKAGRTPHSCPPPKGSDKAKLDGKALFTELGAMPAAQQRATSMKDAFYAMMKKRFPC